MLVIQVCAGIFDFYQDYWFPIMLEREIDFLAMDADIGRKYWFDVIGVFAR